MENSTMRGSEIMIFTYSGSSVQPIAMSDGCDISIDHELSDISNKDSGNASEFIPTIYSWTMSNEGFYCINPTGTTNGSDELIKYELAGTKLYVSFAFASGTKPSWTVDTSKGRFSGRAYISNIKISASNKDTTKFTCNLKGTGQLTYTS